jgi:hypothetical protein
MNLLFAWCLSPALAADTAELRRLEDELVKLAQRNTWAGVERTYKTLMTLDTKLSPLDHQLAAKAAFANGQTLLAYYRLRRAATADPGADPTQIEARDAALAEFSSIDERYRLVSIYAAPGAVPVLYRDAMPFGQEERDAVEAAQAAIRATHSFRGLLPLGNYALDAVKFEVTPGADWLVITAGER